MQSNRIKKASLNLITTALFELITFVCGLIIPRLILSNYGSAYNGIASSITQFFGMISILRLGVAGATRVALYKTLAANDIEGTSAIVRATEKYMRKIGFAIVAYIVFLALVYPRIVDTEVSNYDVVVLIIAAGIGSFAQYFFGITYQTFLAADQSLYIYNVFQSVSTMLNAILSVFLIEMGCTIQEVKLCSSVVFLITPFCMNYYVTKKYHLDKKCAPDNSSLRQRRDVLASSLANIIHGNTDIVVLTIFCNVKEVSVYSVYNLVMNALKAILRIFSTGTEAIFGDMWARKQYESIRKNLSLYEYIIGVFISVIYSTTLLLILPFVSLYTDGITDVKYYRPDFAYVITIAMACFCFRTPYLTLVQGVGHYKETKKGSYFEAGLNIVSSVILVNIIGITGTAIGTLLANVFRSFQYAFYIDNHIITRGKKVIIIRPIWIAANILLVFLVANPIISIKAQCGWLDWCICAICLVLISTIVVLVSSFMCYRDDMKNALCVIKRMIRKGKN